MRFFIFNSIFVMKWVSYIYQVLLERKNELRIFKNLSQQAPLLDKGGVGGGFGK